jgi:hypothetical protein
MEIKSADLPTFNEPVISSTPCTYKRSCQRRHKNSNRRITDQCTCTIQGCHCNGGVGWTRGSIRCYQLAQYGCCTHFHKHICPGTHGEQIKSRCSETKDAVGLTQTVVTGTTVSTNANIDSSATMHMKSNKPLEEYH